MYCLKCGKVNKKDNKKCINCGVPFDETNTSKTKPERIKKDVVKATPKKNSTNKTTTKKSTKTTPKKDTPVKKTTKVTPNKSEKKHVEKKITPKKDEKKEVPIVEEVLEKINVVPEEVKEELKEERKINSGGIRKNLKKDARSRNNSEFCKLGITYGIITLLIYGIFAFLINSFGLLEADTSAVISFLSGLKAIFLACVDIYFAITFICAAIDAVRGKKTTFLQMIKRPFEKVNGRYNSGVLSAFGVFVIFGIGLSIISAIFSLIPFIRVLYFVALVIFLIYVMPAFIMLLYLYIDPEYKTTNNKEMIKKAFEITKGNRIEFYGVYLSFMGWLLLSVLSFGILYYVWVCPYMELTTANLYLKWKKERNFNKPENIGVGNAALLIISFLGAGLFMLVFMISMIISFTLFTMLR